jgi:hypothetical protein
VIALALPACGTGTGGGTLTPTVAPGIPTNVTARAGNRSATNRLDRLGRRGAVHGAPLVSPRWPVLPDFRPRRFFASRPPTSTSGS